MISYNLVIVLKDTESAADWLTLASRLLPEGGEISVFGIITIDSDKSLSEGVLPARIMRDRLSQAVRNFEYVQDDVRIFVDYQPFSRVVDEVTQTNADLVLVQWDHPKALIGGMSAEDIFQVIPCDVVLISGQGWLNEGNVLLSLRGGPNMTLGVRVALGLVQSSMITLLHVRDNSRAAPDLTLIANSIPQIRRTLTVNADIVDGIVNETASHKAVVLGASFRRPERHLPSGNPVIEDVFTRTGKPVILVRGGSQEPLQFHVPQLISAEMPLSSRVDRWFAENTFDSSEFSNLRELMALKEKRAVTISIALPALNEEATVGEVIRTLKTSLMEDVPLVDEIVVIDSNSTDRTVEIAESCGVPVYKHPDILRDEVGTYSGKGEALWKSLHVTKGDIVAWIDTDITNIHPRFIYGLVGPLLKKPRIQYVKGFYARPIQVGDKVHAFGGGRVTELVARPLLNLFYPELSGIVQPLSGEYAGWRSALEQMPFFTGYGVETGLLIDMHDQYGLEGIAQTDLEVRVHHNQPIANLSKMSFAILQVFISRIEKRYNVRLLEFANRSMKLIVQEPERFALELAAITELERPPMQSILSYHQQRALASNKG